MKAHLFYTALLALVLFTQQATRAQVFYFNIRAEIDPRTERKLSLALQEAKEKQAKVVLLELNTFGGQLNSADSMRRALLDYPLPVLVWINKNAASAGALISIACDSIYMNEGASIGAASVVNQEGKLAPGKYQSYMRSLMRATAEANGRDPEIAQNMVYILKDSSKQEKQVITLTTKEAMRKGFCEGQASSVQEVLQLAGYENEQLLRYELPTIEKVIAFFLNPFISGILLALILGGIYFELQSPGIGFALGLAVVAAVLYFVPYYLSGLAAHWEILVLFAGMALLVLEVFVIPGFGVAGIGGIILTAFALMLMMLSNDVLDFTFVPQENIVGSVVAVLGSLVVFILLVIVGGIGLADSAFAKRIALQTTLAEDEETREQREHELPAGTEAETITPLKPGGKIQIGDKQYHAFTSGEYIGSREKVVIVEKALGGWKVRKAKK